MGTRQTKSESPSGPTRARADVFKRYGKDRRRMSDGAACRSARAGRVPQDFSLISEQHIYWKHDAPGPDLAHWTQRPAQDGTGGRLCVCHSNLVENTRTDAGARPPPDLDHRERTPLLQFCDMIVRHARLARSRNAHSIQAAGTHRAARRRALSITHAALARAPKAMRCVWSVCHAVASPRPRTTQPPSRNPQT